MTVKGVTLSNNSRVTELYSQRRLEMYTCQLRVDKVFTYQLRATHISLENLPIDGDAIVLWDSNLVDQHNQC